LAAVETSCSNLFRHGVGVIPTRAPPPGAGLAANVEFRLAGMTIAFPSSSARPTQKNAKPMPMHDVAPIRCGWPPPGHHLVLREAQQRAGNRTVVTRRPP